MINFVKKIFPMPEKPPVAVASGGLAVAVCTPDLEIASPIRMKITKFDYLGCNGLANVSDESKVPKVTTKSIEAHRRRKRQLYIDESWRWNTTILYRFKWNQEPYPEKQADWEEEIRKGLDHIS